MSAVITISPALSWSTMWASATSKPEGTWIARMKRDGGVRSMRLATRTVGICSRSAARKTISLTTAGQASASIQICMGLPKKVGDKRAQRPNGDSSLWHFC